MQDNDGDSLIDSYKDARNLVRQAVSREVKALESVLTFAEPGGRNEQYVLSRAVDVRSREKSLLAEVDRLYTLISGEKRGPEIRPTDIEKTAAAKVPANIESLADYFDKRGWSVRDTKTMHSVMAKECFNYVDGRNSYLDIYNAVRAEILSAGRWYYGDIRLKDVCDMLDEAVKNGVLVLKPAPPQK
ncbi:MAG TPA: hypothetical protein ENO11_00120 [Desulfobacteraceae bacterium]|nr:hypothetical protein [Desulfobacteraceae bacterium]